MMIFRPILAAVVAVFCLMAIAQDAYAQNTTRYDRPTVQDGQYRLDWCLDFGGRCGKAAADAYCRSKGHTGASRFEQDPNIGARSPIYNERTRRYCREPACDGFKFIDCSGRPARGAVTTSPGRQVVTQQRAPSRSAERPVVGCVDADGDGVPAASCGGQDCNDNDPRIYPGAVEICDSRGRDEDCDSQTFGRDEDRDGFQDARCCNGSRCGRDCDDRKAGVNPGASEICDGRDNNCNGTVDEDGVQGRFWWDMDLDGYGDRTREVFACHARPGRRNTKNQVIEPGLVPNNYDCDDSDPRVNPTTGEICGAN